jgi:HEAT repeat protein
MVYNKPKIIYRCRGGKMVFLKYNETFARALFVLFLVAVIGIPGLSSGAEDLQRIREELKHGDWNVRLAAVEKLSNRKDENAIDILIYVTEMRDEYWPVKIKAITLLGDSGNPRAIESLLATFNDSFMNWECPSIKSYAAAALGNFRDDSRVLEALIEGVGDRELLTREASIQSLGKLRNPKAVPRLLSVLNDKSATVRLSAIKSLEQIGDPQAIPHLRRMAENEGDAVVRGEAVSALGNFGQGKGTN